MDETQNIDVVNANTEIEPPSGTKVVESNSWDAVSERLQSSKARAGLTIAAPARAAPLAPIERTVGETAGASLRQGLTAQVFGGFQYDDDAEVDPDFDVVSIVRPQDLPYAAQLAAAPNMQEAMRLQADIDSRNRDYESIQARPWVSGIAAMADPLSLGFDIATYGLARGVTLPLLANNLRRTQAAVKALEIAKRSPRAFSAGLEAGLGATSGAASIYAQEKLKSSSNILNDEDHIGETVFFGAMIGTALGGAVGTIGYKRTQELVNRFREANSITQNAAAPPNGFVGPLPEVVSSGAKADLGLRAQAPKESPTVRSSESIQTDVEALKAEATTGGEPKRASAYERIRAQMSLVGEDIITGKSLPPVVKQAMSFVSWPYRNMSATNQLLFSKLGTARLYAIGLARNATEFMGTREGLVLPRSAQNRIEDISNRGVEVQLDLYNSYLRANGIEPAKFASEKLTFGQRAYEETAFFNDVGTQILHVGKPSEKTRGVSTHIQDAAKHVYENFYRPMGDTLKDLGLIAPDTEVVQELNYLNRHWKSSNLLNDPEGFKNWAAGYYDTQNEKLKTLLPAYHQGMKDVRNLQTQSRRFNKAADEIDKLKAKVEDQKNFAGKIESLNQESQDFVETTKERYDGERAKIEDKYEKMREQGVKKTPNVKQAKAALKKEVSSALKERDTITQQYNTERQGLKSQITTVRNNLRIEKNNITEGGRDSKINSLIPESTEILDEDYINAGRRTLVTDARVAAYEKIDTLKIKIAVLDNEKKTILDIHKAELDSNVREGVELLEAQSKLQGKQSQEAKIKELVDLNEKLELKTADIKEAHAIALHKQKVAQQVAKINEDVATLEYMQQKFSRAGFEAYATRKGAQNNLKFLQMRGMTDEQAKAFVNNAKRIERRSIKNAAVVDEARIIADELAEGATEELVKAEAIIPWELRSNKTGAPYRPYDNPRGGYEQAERTFYTMIGQEDEIVVNPVLTGLGGGRPGMFKSRDLKMPDNYPGIEDWVERDARVLVNNFASGVAPPIALTELMHELNKIDIVQQTVKRMQVLDKSIGVKKALELDTVMTDYNEIPKVFATMAQEEYRMLANGLTGEESIALQREFEKAQKKIGTLWDQIRGVNSNGVNVNARDASDVIDLINSAASTVTTNNIVFSMMGDLASPVMRYGFQKYTKVLTNLLASDELRAISAQELNTMGLGLKTALGTIVKNRISGRQGSLKNSSVGSFISNFANRIGNITGANTMQSLMEVSAGVIIKSELLHYAERAALGTITPKELTHLAQRAVSKEQAIGIYNLWKKFGFEKEGTRGIDPAKFDQLVGPDSQAFHDYSRFINDDLKTLLVKPGTGSLPEFAYSPGGKSILFLKKYFLAATNDLLVPALQRGDREAVEGFTSLFAVGALISHIRAFYRGGEKKEFNLEGFITEALTNSGLPGIWTLGVDLGIASGILAGTGGARNDPSNGVASILLGPGVVGLSDRTLSILGKMRKIMTDEDRQFTYNDFNYIASTAVPLYKWAPISSVAKPNLRNYFESIGRGE